MKLATYIRYGPETNRLDFGTDPDLEPALIFHFSNIDDRAFQTLNRIIETVVDINAHEIFEALRQRTTVYFWGAAPDPVRFFWTFYGQSAF